MAHEGLDTLAEEMRVAAEAHEGAERRSMPSTASGTTAAAYLHFALAHPAHFRVMHAVPEVRAQPRSDAAAHARPCWRRPRMEALVAAGVVAPEAAGRALLACWTSVHGLAQLAVAGQLPLDDELTLEAALDAVLRTAMLGAGVDAGAAPARASAARRRLPGHRRARAPTAS